MAKPLPMLQLVQIQTARARSEWHQAEEIEWYTSVRQGIYAWLSISAETNSKTAALHVL
jgi:hypothetical protein